MYPRSVLEASTASTASTAYREGPVTPYIHAVNAVYEVEASNTDIGANWVWGLSVVPPPQVVPPNCMKCVFHYMYPRSVL